MFDLVALVSLTGVVDLDSVAVVELESDCAIDGPRCALHGPADKIDHRFARVQSVGQSDLVSAPF